MITQLKPRLLAIIFAGMLSSVPAFATPPLNAWIDDHPVAVSETHLYIQRHVKDNRGSYGRTYSESYLLKIDVNTGALQDTRLMYQNAADFEDKEAFKAKANKDFNLFEYLESERAALIIGEFETPETISVTTGYYTHLVSRMSEFEEEAHWKARGTVASMSRDDILSKINQSVEGTMERYIGPLPDTVPNAEIYTLSGTFEDRCDLEKLTLIPGPFDFEDMYLLYLSCPGKPYGEVDLYGNIILPVPLEFGKPQTGTDGK